MYNVGPPPTGAPRPSAIEPARARLYSVSSAPVIASTTIPTPSSPLPTIQVAQAPQFTDPLHLHSHLPADHKASFAATQGPGEVHGRGVLHAPKLYTSPNLALSPAHTVCGAGTTAFTAVSAAATAPQPLATAVTPRSTHH